MVKAEQTLSTLEAFRTPLHNSVSSASHVDKVRPRKVHVPFPSKLRFDHTPESKRDKAKRVPDIIGPYSSGMPGIRKLLARHKEELEKESERNSKKVPPEHDSGVTGAEAEEQENQKDEVTDIVPESRQGRDQVNGSSSKRLKGDTYSSLRAPSGKAHRSHASAPKLKKPRNKFSLDDEEEEGEWGMSVEELKKYHAQVRDGLLRCMALC